MKPKFYRKVLKNGMTVVFEKRDLPIVAVGFAVRAGGANEKEGEKGISHFIEHMLYKGTASRNAIQIAKAIERNGGELNGFTDEIITGYWCKMPNEHLNVALNVLSDMIKNPLFDEKELEKERLVIFEEIKMRKDNPRIYVLDRIHEFLYDKPHGLNLIGTHETMNSISREVMVKKFEEIYQPNNMVLCVVGDANFQDIIKFVEKEFGDKKGIVNNFKVKKKVEQKTEKRKGIDQANMVLAYHIPLAGEKGSYDAMVLTTLMGEGMSSRLFSEIREKRNLAYTVKAMSEITKNFAYSVIYVGTTKEKVEKAKELIIKEFEKVSEELTEKELEEVKKQLIGNYKIGMEDSVLQMTNLLLWEMNGNAENFYDFEKNIQNVKLKDVKKLAKIKDYGFFALLPE